MALNPMLPAVLFIVCGAIAFFVFKSYTNGIKHIDGTDIKEYEAWVTAIGIGVMGFCVGKLFTIDNDGGNDGFGGGDYFDCTGGAGGIM